MGDPVVVRRDGVVAYQLAVVVDDHGSGVDRVVRGHDIAPSTATQVALHHLLGWPVPRYRHHLLLIAERGDKLAKLHGSMPSSELRFRHAGDELCGILAAGVGLRAQPTPCHPRELLADFTWARVAADDRIARWAGGLVIAPARATLTP